MANDILNSIVKGFEQKFKLRIMTILIQCKSPFYSFFWEKFKKVLKNSSFYWSVKEILHTNKGSLNKLKKFFSSINNSLFWVDIEVKNLISTFKGKLNIKSSIDEGKGCWIKKNEAKSVE
jgi:hypothetical protein